MKVNEIKKASVSTLTQIAEAEKIDLTGKDSKKEIIEAVTLHFFPASDATDDALENSKEAKKPAPHRVKLAKVYDTFRALLPDAALSTEKGDPLRTVDTVKGVEATFWKSSEESADFWGVTLRFDDTVQTYGKDRAILGNIRKALKSIGIPVTTVTIRNAGALTMWA